MNFKPLLLLPLLLALITGCVRSNWQGVCERVENAEQDFVFLQSSCESWDDLTLADLIAYARQRNLDIKIKQQEIAYQHEVATGQKYQMLPEFLAEGELSHRNNTPGASSESLEPGVPPAPPSVSSEKTTRRWNFTLTWNLLDFGISYFRARQEVNREMIGYMDYCRLEQNLINDLSHQYWTALAAQKSVKLLDNVIEKLRLSEIKMQHNIDNGWLNDTIRLETLNRMIELEMLREEQRNEYRLAMENIKQLVGIAIPTDRIQLRDIPFEGDEALMPNLEEMEQLALLHRPELYVQDIQDKIDADEVHAAYLSMFPGVSLFTGDNRDLNRFLIRHEWLTYGLRASWDLFSIPYFAARASAAKTARVITYQNRLAMSMAAIAQVNSAFWLFQYDRDQYLLSKEAESVKLKLASDAAKRQIAGRLSDLQALNYETDAVEAQVVELTAYGNMRASLEQINNALGMPGHYRMEQTELFTY